MKTTHRDRILWLVCLLTPSIIVYFWGVNLSDAAYMNMLRARELSKGISFTPILQASSTSSHTTSLYPYLLAALDKTSLPLHLTSVVLSSISWGAIAFILHQVSRRWMRAPFIIVMGGLVLISPLFLELIGSGLSLALLCSWISIASLMEKRWRLHLLALILLLAFLIDIGTLFFVILLFGLFSRVRQKILGHTLIFLGIVLIAGWGLSNGDVNPGFLRADLWSFITGLTSIETDVLLLLLPLIAWGGVKSPVEIQILWGGMFMVSLLVESAFAQSLVLLCIPLFLATGSSAAIHWASERSLVRLDIRSLQIAWLMLIGLPAMLLLSLSLVRSYPYHSNPSYPLEQCVAGWVTRHTEASDTLLTSARGAYLAARPAWIWSGENSSQSDLTQIIRALKRTPPMYCISTNNLGWDLLIQTTWFRETYQIASTFSTSGQVNSIALWKQRHPESHRGSFIDVSYSLPHSMQLRGYRFHPRSVHPGNPLYATLFLQATEPLTQNIQPVVEIYSSVDGVNFGQREAFITPDTLERFWWRDGNFLAQSYILTPPDHIPTGVYQLDLLVEGTRLTLEDVVVPWTGDLSDIQPVTATLAGEIRLLGFKASRHLTNGYPVTLYWKAEHIPTKDYKVFVHLLDVDGNLVTNHDGVPAEGRYPTTSWRPGDIIEDKHVLSIPPDLQSGLYRLQVGMYRWPSLERLEVRESQGELMPSRTIFLQYVEKP